MDAKFSYSANYPRAISWFVAVLSIALFLPYVALSTYGFPTLDDVVLYSRVKEDGLWSTTWWYYELVSGRIPVFFIHGALADAVDKLGGNIWVWNQISSVLYNCLLVVGFGVLFKTLLPRLHWCFVIVLATIPFVAVMTYHNPASGPDGLPMTADASQMLLPMVLAIYGISFALYVLTVSAFVMFLERQSGQVAPAVALCLVSFVYLATHEVTLIPMGLFLIILAILSLDFDTRERRFSIIFPFNRLTLGISLRPVFDNRIFIVTMVAQGVLLGASAAIHVFSPSVAARASYWPAKMSIWDALGAAIPPFLTMLGDLVSVAKPFFILLFFLVLFLARTTPMRRILHGHNRHLLLVPMVTFLIIAFVSLVASMVMVARPIPRVQHYNMQYGLVAVSCLAIYLANGPLLGWLTGKTASRLAAFAMIGLFAAFAGDPWYRQAVNVAMGSGYRYSQSIGERVDALSQGKGRIVEVAELKRPPPLVYPIFHDATTELYFHSLLAKAFDQQKVIFIPCGRTTTPKICHYQGHIVRSNNRR